MDGKTLPEHVPCAEANPEPAGQPGRGQLRFCHFQPSSCRTLIIEMLRSAGSGRRRLYRRRLHRSAVAAWIVFRPRLHSASGHTERCEYRKRPRQPPFHPVHAGILSDIRPSFRAPIRLHDVPHLQTTPSPSAMAESFRESPSLTDAVRRKQQESPRLDWKRRRRHNNEFRARGANGRIRHHPS